MRILLLANGSEPTAALLGSLRARCDRFIAADGGGNTALKLGFQPDTIIGDLDSFRPDTGFGGELIGDPDQETNDLEKALSYARSLRAIRVDILGASGKRLDHTLKNLSVLQQFDPFFETLACYDDRFFTRILPRDFSIQLPPGHLVSLFPLSGRVDGIVTEGLRYPLSGESLQNGRRDGTSNQSLGETVRIRHTGGCLLFMTALIPDLL